MCVVGLLCVFRCVDRWELAAKAIDGDWNRLSQLCYSQPLKLSGCREKEEKHFSSYIPLPPRLDFSKSWKSTVCPTSELLLDWFGLM